MSGEGMIASDPERNPQPPAETEAQQMARIMAKGRGTCLCPTSTIRRIIIDHGTCHFGGCPYGGDF